MPDGVSASTKQLLGEDLQLRLDQIIRILRWGSDQPIIDREFNVPSVEANSSSQCLRLQTLAGNGAARRPAESDPDSCLLALLAIVTNAETVVTIVHAVVGFMTYQNHLARQNMPIVGDVDQ
jgi:hypothetical protein